VRDIGDLRWIDWKKDEEIFEVEFLRFQGIFIGDKRFLFKKKLIQCKKRNENFKENFSIFFCVKEQG
jgi:hypothetical protein